MSAAEEGQSGVCMKLAELGANLNKGDKVCETCCTCMSVCRCIIVMLIFFSEIGWGNGFDVGCCKGSVGSVFETG